MKLSVYYFFFSIFLFVSALNAQNLQGPLSPTSVTQQDNLCLACPGAVWQNFNNVKVSDGLYATTQLAGYPQCTQGACYYAREIIATNFGFTIPSNAVITGVKADVQRLAGAANIIYDSAISLIKNNILIGSNKASATDWPLTDTYISYGDSTDSWTAPLTPADVNDTTFGIIVKPYNTATSGFTAADVDHIQLTVYYTISTTVATLATINDLKITVEENNIVVRFNTSQSDKSYSLSVFNTVGQRIYLKDFNTIQGSNFSESINASDFSNGLYIVTISNDAGTFSRNVIIEK